MLFTCLPVKYGPAGTHSPHNSLVVCSPRARPGSCRCIRIRPAARRLQFRSAECHNRPHPELADDRREPNRLPERDPGTHLLLPAALAPRRQRRLAAADDDPERPALTDAATRFTPPDPAGGPRPPGHCIRRQKLARYAGAGYIQSAALARSKWRLVSEGVRHPRQLGQPCVDPEVRGRQLHRRCLAQRPVPRVPRGRIDALRFRCYRGHHPRSHQPAGG